MKTLREFREDRLEEGIIRSSAVTLYAAKAKDHGERAVHHFAVAKTDLVKMRQEKDFYEKMNILTDVLTSTLSGMTELRQQLGAISAQVTSASVLSKNSR